MSEENRKRGHRVMLAWLLLVIGAPWDLVDWLLGTNKTSRQKEKADRP